MRGNALARAAALTALTTAAALGGAGCTRGGGGSGGGPGPTTRPTSSTTRAPATTTATKPVPSTTRGPGPVRGVPANAAWTSSDQWGNWSNGGYTLYNNIWGKSYAGSGRQTIWANSYRNWGVYAEHGNTGNIKSYPDVGKDIGRPLSSLGRLSSRFAVQVPSGGAYNTAYDIWCNGSTYEIMLWMNWSGPVGPIRDQNEYTATVGGHSWKVYTGTNGNTKVFSFLRQGSTDAGTVDVKAVLDWIKGRGWFGEVSVDKVQFGWEITSSPGGMNFTTTDYEVTAG